MKDYSEFDCFKVEKEEKVAVVTFNQPETLNSFNAKLHKQTEQLFLELADEDTVNAIVLTGAGKAFSAGGDIKKMQSGELFKEISPEEAIRFTTNFLQTPQPVIAAVNGDAIGLGATIALFCDIVIISEQAKIADPHVSVGLVAGDGGCIIWPLLIGMNRAKEMLLTGKMLEAKEAESIGLVNYCVPPDQVMPKALEMAHSLANGPARAIQWTKMAVNKKLLADVNLILPTSIGFEFLTMHTEDHKEAATAFVEKRKPNFTGK